MSPGNIKKKAMRKTFLLLALILILLLHTLSSQADPPSNALVIRRVTIIDATGAQPKPNMTLVIAEGRISSIGADGSVSLPKGARVIEAQGKFLIPGLWDMHAHLSKTGESTLPLFIANGVTSVRDMGGDYELLLRWRKEIAEGKRLGPRIKTAGPILESASNVERMKREGTVEPVDRFRIGVPNAESAEEIVARVAAMNVDFIKIRTVASLETYRAIAAAAQKHSLALVGHPAASPEEIIKAGQRSVEHSFIPPLSGRTPEQRADLFRKMAAAKIAVTPTLVVGEALLVPYDKAAAISEDNQGKVDSRRRYLSGYLIEDWREQVAERKEVRTNLTKLFSERLRDLREMHQSGVVLLPGTDAGVLLIFPGFSLHDELRLLVEQAGLTPMEAIVSATRQPAEFLGIEQSLGTIEKGKIADLVLLEANPLDDIGATGRIAGVAVAGRFFSKAELQRMLADVEAAASGKKRNE
jgi:imidazolonepropionase-like amidohydrolase